VAGFMVDKLESNVFWPATRYRGVTANETDDQFTAKDFIDVLREHRIGISMDGKGCWRDNVFVERLWKTIKHEHVYLHAYQSVSDARAKLAVCIDFYNRRRPHSSLDRRTPDDAYFDLLPLKLAA
jgi:putative transposase